MATLESDDANIVEATAVNWRLVVYPLVATIVLVLGGFGYYYCLQNQRDLREAQAHDAAFQAKTPEAFIQIADQFPDTNQGVLALLSAANLSFDKKDYASALKNYQRVISHPEANALQRDAAQLGVASTFEATDKADDAINAYLTVAHRGKDTPYSPYAYAAITKIYEQRGDKENQRKILLQLTSLNVDSPFVKEAQQSLKELSPEPALAPTTASPSPAPAAPQP